MEKQKDVRNEFSLHIKEQTKKKNYQKTTNKKKTKNKNKNKSKKKQNKKKQGDLDESREITAV